VVDPKKVAEALMYPKAKALLSFGLETTCPACGQLYEIGFSWVEKGKIECRKCGITFRIVPAW